MPALERPPPALAELYSTWLPVTVAIPSVALAMPPPLPVAVLPLTVLSVSVAVLGRSLPDPGKGPPRWIRPERDTSAVAAGGVAGDLVFVAFVSLSSQLADAAAVAGCGVAAD